MTVVSKCNHPDKTIKEKNFTIVNNSSTGEDELITLVAGANSTIYGNLVTENDAQDKGSGSSSWRIRFTAVTGTETYVVYRIA